MSQVHTPPIPTTIDAGATGTILPPSAFQASARATMAYASALKADEDIYLNDLRDHGLQILPPMIVVPEWRVMNGQAYRQALGQEDEGMWQCLHVQQDSRFLSPLEPGQSWLTTGRIQCLRQTRIGVYVAVQLHTHDARDDRLLVDSWFCGIFLGAELQGSSLVHQVAAPTLPTFPANSPHTRTLPMLHVSRTLPHLYTAAADIWNPIHTERRAARRAGLADILLHGTYTWACAGLHLIRAHAASDARRLRRLAGRMASKVPVGASLNLQWTAGGEPEPSSATTPADASGTRPIRYQVVDDGGTVVLADGLAEFDEAEPRLSSRAL